MCKKIDNFDSKKYEKNGLKAFFNSSRGVFTTVWLEIEEQYYKTIKRQNKIYNLISLSERTFLTFCSFAQRKNR